MSLENICPAETVSGFGALTNGAGEQPAAGCTGSGPDATIAAFVLSSPLRFRRRLPPAADCGRPRNRAAFHVVFRRSALVEAAVQAPLPGAARGCETGDIRAGADRPQEEGRPGQRRESRRLRERR